MSKKVWLISLSVISLVAALSFILININSKDKATNKQQVQEFVKAEGPYKEFDAAAEEFFIAYQIKDYDTMKKYLPKSEVEQSLELTDAKKGDILHPNYREEMKGQYKIKATDFYYKSHNQIIYLVDFWDPATGNPHRFGIYGVEKKNNKYFVINRIDSMINGLHFKQETGNAYLRISTLKELMAKYPNNVYEVKSQY
jgi:hypothetical protein